MFVTNKLIFFKIIRSGWNKKKSYDFFICLNLSSMTHVATDIGVWLRSASWWNNLEVAGSIPTTVE